MTLTELIPAIRTLPYADKLRLQQALESDLALEQEVMRLFPSGECPIWSPGAEQDSIAVLQQALEQDKGNNS